MVKTNIYKIAEKHDGMLVKDYLYNVLLMSKRNVLKLKNNQGIYVNNKKTRVIEKLYYGDNLQLQELPSMSEHIAPENINLNILYEDEYIIAVNKTSNMPVHQSKGHLYGTLSNGIAYYYEENGINSKIRPVNRLDKDTSGIVIFAKTPHIQHLFSSQAQFRIKKEYIAIVSGHLNIKKGRIDLPIGKLLETDIRRAVVEDGERAVTDYEVINEQEGISIVKLVLQTGRTHQIRVHLSHIGHPILGDALYGGDCTNIDRQALHAFRSSFTHPITHEKITIESQLPEDIARIVKQ